MIGELMHKSKFTQAFAKYYNAGKTEAFFLMEKKIWQVILRKKAFIWHKNKIDYHTTSKKQIIPVNYCIYSEDIWIAIEKYEA